MQRARNGRAHAFSAARYQHNLILKRDHNVLFILTNSTIIPGVILPPHLAHLPPPSPEAAALSEALVAHVVRDIQKHNGWISFARYMELALYTPGLGYYAAGARKLGEGGDFVTAPEMTPLFAQCIARQVLDLGLPHILELGAGSGALAVELLLELERLECVPHKYFILEVSADLRERQRERIAQLSSGLEERVEWLDVLPSVFEGVILANEVLDAIPACVVTTCQGAILEAFVQYSSKDGLFSWYETTAPDHVSRAANQLNLPKHDYRTEINLSTRALVTRLAQILTRGVMLFIDYGFPAREFYHSQRSCGTLMCHYRHHAHDDPFSLVGLQDITTHVDFSAVAEAAHAGGAALLGYANQAQFLINCGITERLSQVPASDTARYAPLAAAAQKLLSPAEMGELFKVIALGKGVSTPLLGFTRGDKSHTL